eukprot:GILI01009997.1.p1 GENE.GILI01009997.1~~GILI01009997.1.p1  ORF type:complete len:419 (-),score=50.96 GILI01009997.1:44-1300(-)
MIRYPSLYQASVRPLPQEEPTDAQIQRGTNDWASLVDALDSECPLLVAETLDTLNARPPFNAAVGLPENTDSLLPQGHLASANIPYFLSKQHATWESKLYGKVFVRQVDPSEQFHSVPAPPRAMDDMSHFERLPPNVTESINFKTLLYGEPNSIEKTDIVFGEDSEEEDDLSPYGVPGRKLRRLERDENGRLLTPAEREAALKEIMATHKTKRLNAFFTNTLISSTAAAASADFNPIILISPLASAALQISNIYAFLHDGHYVDPQKGVVDEVTGAPIRRRKEKTVTVSPGEFLDTNKFMSAFRQFDVYDDPTQLLPSQWKRVCGAIVTDEVWQFDEWYPTEPHLKQPSVLFSNIRGFLPFFEEDILPQRLREWRVQPLILTRKLTKSGAHISQAIRFWTELFSFLDTHDYFRQFTQK